MKSIYTLAVIVALGLISARADEALSPKAREQRAESLRGGTEVKQIFEFTRGNKIAVFDQSQDADDFSPLPVANKVAANGENRVVTLRTNLRKKA